MIGLHPPCGTPLVMTKNAIGVERARCPKCQGVAARTSPLHHSLHGTSQAEHAPPRPKAPTRRRVVIEEPMARPRTSKPAPPLPRMSERREPSGLEGLERHVAQATHADLTRRLRKERDARKPARAKAIGSAASAPKRTSPLKGRKRGALTAPRTYKPKPCRLCETEFTPTGPRAAYCGPCGGTAE